MSRLDELEGYIKLGMVGSRKFIKTGLGRSQGYISLGLDGS